MDNEAEINELKIQYAVIESRLENHFSQEDEFQTKVLSQLEYLQKRDMKVFEFIENSMEKEKARTALWRALYTELAKKGVWAFLLLLGYTVWYTFVQYIHKG